MVCSSGTEVSSHWLLSRKLEADLERGRIAVGCWNRRQHELIAAAPENTIVLVSGRARSSCGIRGVGVDAVGQSVIKIHLRCELKASPGHGRRANLEMDVHRPAFIPAGVYGDKPGFATRVGDLVATEKLPTDGIEIRIPHVRIDAQRIAVPDIDLSPRERLTVSGAESRDQHRQSQWRAGPDQPLGGIGTDVGTMQALVDEIRTFGLFGTDYTRGIACVGTSSKRIQTIRQPQCARGAKQSQNFAAGKETAHRLIVIASRTSSFFCARQG